MQRRYRRHNGKELHMLEFNFDDPLFRHFSRILNVWTRKSLTPLQTVSLSIINSCPCVYRVTSLSRFHYPKPLIQAVLFTKTHIAAYYHTLHHQRDVFCNCTDGVAVSHPVRGPFQKTQKRGNMATKRTTVYQFVFLSGNLIVIMGVRRTYVARR